MSVSMSLKANDGASLEVESCAQEINVPLESMWYAQFSIDIPSLFCQSVVLRLLTKRAHPVGSFICLHLDPDTSILTLCFETEIVISADHS